MDYVEQWARLLNFATICLLILLWFYSVNIIVTDVFKEKNVHGRWFWNCRSLVNISMKGKKKFQFCHLCIYICFGTLIPGSQVNKIRRHHNKDLFRFWKTYRKLLSVNLVSSLIVDCFCLWRIMVYVIKQPENRLLREKSFVSEKQTFLKIKTWTLKMQIFLNLESLIWGVISSCSSFYYFFLKNYLCNKKFNKNTEIYHLFLHNLIVGSTYGCVSVTQKNRTCSKSCAVLG